MREITETITISKERHDELLRKEFAFDAYKRKIRDDKYLTDLEKALFLEEEKLEIPTFLMVEEVPIESEEGEPIVDEINREVWDEIEALAGKEKDNGTEIV